MILMRNINGRCPENMLVLVPIASRAMVAAILFNFSVCCATISLDHRDMKSYFADLTSLIKLTNRV